MGILSDITQAVEAYPHEYLTLEIVEVDAPGTTINVRETVNFRIQVTNTGPLDVFDLDILVEGLNGTLVKTGSALDDFGPTATLLGSQLGDGVVPAHSGNAPVVSSGSVLSFQPTRASGTPVDLVRISVAGWNTDFGHIHRAHSRADAEANGVFDAVVARS